MLFLRDKQFGAALVAALLFWGVMIQLIPPQPVSNVSQFSQWLLLALLYPVLEEAAFRGWIQGYLHEQVWGRHALAGVSVANVATSCLFGLSHLFYHVPLWSLAVVVPSLIFGFFRDRYGSIVPGLVLHCFYNSGYYFLYPSS